MDRRFAELTRPLPVQPRDDPKRAAAQLPRERAHEPQCGEGGSRLRSTGALRRRYDRLYDERISELRLLARRRTGRALIGSLASSAVTVGTISMLSWLYVTDRMSLSATGAAVFGLYQLGGDSGAAPQCDLAVRGDALHPGLLVVPHAGGSRRGGHATCSARLRALDGGGGQLHLPRSDTARGRSGLARDQTRRGHRSGRREWIGQDHAGEDARRALPAGRRSDSVGRNRRGGRRRR